jgi:hypothetical protein
MPVFYDQQNNTFIARTITTHSSSSESLASDTHPTAPPAPSLLPPNHPPITLAAKSVTCSSLSSLASSYHTQATQTVDDTVIQNQEYVYPGPGPGDLRVITLSYMEIQRDGTVR